MRLRLFLKHASGWITLSAWSLGVGISCSAPVDEEVRSIAQGYLDKVGFLPIDVPPGTHFQKEVDEQRMRWVERVILEPFAKRAATRLPKQAQEAVEFLHRALYLRFTLHPQDDAGVPARLDKSGRALLKARVDDPLVLAFSEWSTTQVLHPLPVPFDHLKRAAEQVANPEYGPAERVLVYREYQDAIRLNQHTVELMAERVAAMGKAMANGTTYGPEEEELLVEDTHFLFEEDHFLAQEDAVRNLCTLPGLSNWTRLLLEAQFAKAEAHKARGGRVSKEVPQEDWKEYHSQMQTCKDALEEAWHLHEDRPQAAAILVAISTLGPGEWRKDARLWFNRAIAAQFDYMDAYEYYLVVLGHMVTQRNYAKLTALGFACAQTQRYDTRVPGFLFTALKKVSGEFADWHPVYRNEQAAPLIMSVSRALLADPANAWDHDRLLADHGLYAWAAGQWSEAVATLKKVPVFPALTRRISGNFQKRESEIRGESLLFAAGKETAWVEQEAAYRQKDLDTALSICRDIASAMGNKPPAVLLGRIAAIEDEKALSTGQWLTMNVEPNLYHWTVHKGDWQGTPEGVLLVHGNDESAFLAFNARVGANCEFRGEYEMEKPDPHWPPSLGVFVGYANSPRHEQFLTCMQWSMEKDQPLATILNLYFQTSANDIPLDDPSPKSRFLITCRNGRITYQLNGKDYFKDYAPTSKTNRPQVLLPAPDGRVGFCHFALRKATFRILHPEVRRLPETEVTTPSQSAGDPAN